MVKCFIGLRDLILCILGISVQHSTPEGPGAPVQLSLLKDTYPGKSWGKLGFSSYSETSQDLQQHISICWSYKFWPGGTRPMETPAPFASMLVPMTGLVLVPVPTCVPCSEEACLSMRYGEFPAPHAFQVGPVLTCASTESMGQCRTWNGCPIREHRLPGILYVLCHLMLLFHMYTNLCFTQRLRSVQVPVWRHGVPATARIPHHPALLCAGTQQGAPWAAGACRESPGNTNIFPIVLHQASAQCGTTDNVYFTQ